MCDLVFIVVHDEEKSDVSISRLYLNGTGSCCLANTIVITDIRIAACEILPVRKRNLLSMGKGELCLRRGEEPRSALCVLSPCVHCATFKDSGPSEQVRDCHTRETLDRASGVVSTESSGSVLRHSTDRRGACSYTTACQRTENPELAPHGLLSSLTVVAPGAFV